MNKCDSCGQFGELEEIVVTIKKHKACDINGAFGKPTQTTQAPLALPIVPRNSIAPYMEEELNKMK